MVITYLQLPFCASVETTHLFKNHLPCRTWEKCVFSNGIFYCLSDCGYLGVFDPSKATWSILPVKPCPAFTRDTDWSFDEVVNALVADEFSSSHCLRVFGSKVNDTDKWKLEPRLVCLHFARQILNDPSVERLGSAPDEVCNSSVIDLTVPITISHHFHFILSAPFPS
ncbi:F-box/kelch-repeat protein [Cardamine amara subsp. amara]